MSLCEAIGVFESLPPSICISPLAVSDLISSLLELLKQKQTKTTIWVKPATVWTEAIEKYAASGVHEGIYWCQTFATEKSSNTQSDIFTVKLRNNPRLAKEFFLIVISPDFSLLVIAQQQPVSGIPNRISRRQSSLTFSLYSSSEKRVIQRTLETLIEEIEDVDFKQDCLSQATTLPQPQNYDANIMIQLLLQQIEAKDNFRQEKTAIKPQENVVEPISHKSLLWQEEFITKLTDELLPPMTNMRTAICLLESKYLKVNQRQRYLELLHQQWERQNCLLTGLLELVKLDHLSSQEQETAGNIAEILPRIVTAYQPIAREKDIRLKYRPDPLPSDLPLVACPRLWLKQIILNLLDNNLKYTDSGGEVMIEVKLISEGVLLTFTDNGNGILSQELPKIFNSFYRGHNSQGEEYNSAGLGLTVVKQLVDRSGGSITVNSQINKGSTFYVKFKTQETRLDTQK